jgi:hypothetical protein
MEQIRIPRPLLTDARDDLTVPCPPAPEEIIPSREVVRERVSWEEQAGVLWEAAGVGCTRLPCFLAKVPGPKVC